MLGLKMSNTNAPPGARCAPPHAKQSRSASFVVRWSSELNATKIVPKRRSSSNARMSPATSSTSTAASAALRRAASSIAGARSSAVTRRPSGASARAIGIVSRPVHARQLERVTTTAARLVEIESQRGRGRGDDAVVQRRLVVEAAFECHWRGRIERALIQYAATFR